MQRTHTLTHELIHIADNYSLIAYSPEWISFVKANLVTSFEPLKVKRDEWPSISSSHENLKEILADYGACYFARVYFPSSKIAFEEQGLPLLLHPSQENLEWLGLMDKMSHGTMNGEQYVDGLVKLKTLIPNHPWPDWRTACLFAWLGDTQDAIDYSKKFLALCPQYPASHDLSDYLERLVQHALASKKYENCSKILTFLENEYPKEKCVSAGIEECQKLKKSDNSGAKNTVDLPMIKLPM